MERIVLAMHLAPLGIGAPIGLIGKGNGGAMRAIVAFIGLLCFALGGCCAFGAAHVLKGPRPQQVKAV